MVCDPLHITPASTQNWASKGFIVHVYEDIGPKENATILMRNHVVENFKEEQGYSGCYTFLDERSESCGVAIAVFDTIDDASEASENVRVKARNMRLTASDPTSILGSPRIFTAASPEQKEEFNSDSALRADLTSSADEAEKIFQMAVDLYWEIRRGVRQINEEAETELGKWVNILSYVVDNSIDRTLEPARAKDLMKRAELAIDVILLKPQGSLNLVREMRHEIIMDIYRAEDKFSRQLLQFTNGSPSFTVVLGVVTASFFFSLLLAVIHIFPQINIFTRMDRYFQHTVAQQPNASGSIVDQTVLAAGSIEGAAIAAFAGGVVSVLTRLEHFETRRGIDPKLLFLNAVSRPFIGAVMAMFIVAVQGFGLFSIATANPAEVKFAFFLIVVGFLAGFSERFATDFIGNVEGGLGSRRSSPRGQPNN